MEVNFKDTNIENIRADLVVLPVQEHKLNERSLHALDRRLRSKLMSRIQAGKFTGGEGQTLFYPTSGMLPFAYLFLLGIGPSRDVEIDTWRVAAARARKEGAGVSAQHIAFFFHPAENEAETAAAIVEGIGLAAYQFHKYRSNSREAAELKDLTLFRPGLKSSTAIKAAIDQAEAILPGVFLTRDLVNEPPSVATAHFLGEQAKRSCRGPGLSVEVWQKNKIEAMKLAGLLAVNRGSHEEPRFIKIQYRPSRKPRKRIALIGKGITFDSGGLSLKPAKSMETMKMDMSGGAAVIGAMSRLPHLRQDIEVTGYVPTTDNLPGGNAQKPGDIIRYLNGKSIEVLNTDAEGRLILADALALAAQDKPDYMINLATLTGACVVALGRDVAGLFSNDQSLADQLMRCARQSGEKLWPLPLVKEYREDIKSSVADMKNIGGSHGGAIIAALILQEFVEGRSWAHLDIAGPAFAEKETPICPKGATGFGVRTLLKFISSL